MTQEISISGFWSAAWLFTVGYAKLGFLYGLWLSCSGPTSWATPSYIELLTGV